LKRKNLTATLGVKNLLNVQTVNVVGQVQSTHTSAGSLNVGKGTTAFLSLKYNIEIKKK
jgi:outer membrane receptor protein involved in Fe transport